MNKIRKSKFIKFYLNFLLIFIILSSCAAFKPSPVDSRKVPSSAKDRARQNIDTGSGVSINKILKGRGGSGGSFEFSSSNPLWRASLEILDFLPLTTVDYSGGVIITDWYNDSQNSNESLKITVRFLSNEVRSDSVKVIVHQRNCFTTNNCSTQVLNSTIKKELVSSILAKAALLKKESENKK
jgi:hypothetical protein